MRELNLKIIKTDLPPEYLTLISIDLETALDSLQDAEISTNDFSFYTSVASVFSSKIEGEEIELDSYVKHKRFGIEFLPDYTQKIDDLYSAYTFAKTSLLNEPNIRQAHGLLGNNLVPKQYLGKF